MLQSLGNHEFDNGISGLTPFIENLTSPVLAANLILDNEPKLQDEPNLKKSIIFDVDGTKIGVIGYLTPETKILAVKNNVEYIDEITALKKEVLTLQSQGIKIIIALGHSGFKKDLEIAKEVNGLDVVIGGHTNTFLWNGNTPDIEEAIGSYPKIVTQASGEKVLVVQAYAYTKYLGKLHLKFNSKGNIIFYDGNPILLDNSIPQDTDVLKIINRYRHGVLKFFEEIVGNTSIILDGKTCQRKECNLGNLITDAIIYKYASEYHGKHWTNAPIAIIQGGGIRTSIASSSLPSIITKGDLLQVMPFEGPLVTIEVNGTTLKQILERSVANYNDLEDNGELLQFSGIKVVYNLKRPKGSRVIRAVVRCCECDIPQYSEIKEEMLYNIIIPKFLANGGDGYIMFKDIQFQTLNYNELMCTTKYIELNSPVYAEIEGRILFENEAKLSSASTNGAFLAMVILLLNIICFL